MNAQAFRRFLQAPDKVRFPVAAPLILGTLCALVLLATLIFGVLFPFGDAMVRQDRTVSTAHRAYFKAWQLETGALGNLAWDAAREIDRAVVQGARDDLDIARGTFRGWVLSKPPLRRLFGHEPKAVRDLAEGRLRKLSGQAPAWAATARLCEEGAARHLSADRFKWNYTWGMADVAQAYTQVLGREVKPADLLPLVPEGRCE